MARHVIHFYSLLSPWSFLGFKRLEGIALATGATVQGCPVHLPAVFEANGGVPLGKRSPAKQAYRDIEIDHWRTHLGIHIIKHPEHHPFDSGLASRVVVAAERHGAADRLGHAFLRALWQTDADLADQATLRRLVAAEGLDAEALLSAAADDDVTDRYDAYTRDAIDRGVFGVPTYFVGDAMFWGQDRLDLVEARLRALPGADD